MPAVLAIGAKLTRRGGRCHQDAILRDRVDASQHEVGACDELADLVRLGLAIHLEDAGPQGVIAAPLMPKIPASCRVFDLPEWTSAPCRQSLQHHLAGLIAIVDDHHLDIALPHPLCDSLDGLFGRGALRSLLATGSYLGLLLYIIAPPLASIRLFPRKPGDW